MEPNKTAAAIETILFAMGDSVEVSALARPSRSPKRRSARR